MNLLCILGIQIDRFLFYKKQFFLNVVLSFFGVFVEISILQLFTGNDRSIWIYVCLSMAIFSSLATNEIPEYCKSIKKGEVVRYYIRPVNFFHYVLIEEIGNSFFHLVQMLPLLVLAIVLQQASFQVLFFFLLSMLLSILLAAMIAVSVFSLSLMLSNFVATKALLTCISGFFSGGMIPLVMLPRFFQTICYATPFAYLVDGPIQILQQRKGTTILLFQIVWILIFYIAGHFFFKYFEKKISVFGG